jgi:hypothetical protein
MAVIFSTGSPFCIAKKKSPEPKPALYFLITKPGRLRVCRKDLGLPFSRNRLKRSLKIEAANQDT